MEREDCCSGTWRQARAGVVITFMAETKRHRLEPWAYVNGELMTVVMARSF